jgi:hypothetical protein
LANDSDADGDALFFLFATNSTQGGSVTSDTDWVYYTPPASLSGNDTLTYYIQDARDAFTSGTVTIQVQTPPTPTVVASSPRTGGGVTLRLTGVPLASYTVQVSTNLTTWTTLATATADGSGVYTVDDPTAPAEGAGRFYRGVKNP